MKGVHWTSTEYSNDLRVRASWHICIHTSVRMCVYLPCWQSPGIRGSMWWRRRRCTSRTPPWYSTWRRPAARWTDRTGKTWSARPGNRRHTHTYTQSANEVMSHAVQERGVEGRAQMFTEHVQLLQPQDQRWTCLWCRLWIPCYYCTNLTYMYCVYRVWCSPLVLVVSKNVFQLHMNIHKHVCRQRISLSQSSTGLFPPARCGTL